MYFCKKIIQDKFSRPGLAILVLLVITVIITAGCVSDVETGVPETKSAEIPQVMNSVIYEFSQDLNNINRVISVDLYNLGDKIGSASSSSEIEEIAFDYYSQNPWLTSVVYYDAASKKYIDVPVNIKEEILESLPEISSEKLTSAGGTIHYSSVFNPDKGYQELDVTTVLDKNGEFKGYIIISYDVYSLMNFHPMMSVRDKSYGNYILFIVDEKSNKITYSSKAEAIGEIISKDSTYYDGQVIIMKSEDKEGAYKYSSRAFYNYEIDKNTEKITAYSDVLAYKRTFKIYITDEINKPELKTENVYQLTSKEVIKNVVDIYKLEADLDINAAISRINSGYYSTPVYIFDMEGNIIASPFNQEGLNYLNNRGAYGTEYTKNMVKTASQGGGYVYYTTSVEPIVNVGAAEYVNAYILPLDDKHFVMGPFAGSTDVVMVDADKKIDAAAVSREIIKRAVENGLEDVCKEVNNAEDAKYFVPEITSDVFDIAIMDFNGVVYASLNKPDLIGEVLTGYTDVYGGSTIRKAIMTAKSSGGFTNDLVKSETQEGYNDLILISVEPISDNKFVMSAVNIGTFVDVLNPDFKG